MSKEERNTYKIESDENLGEVQIADEVVAIIAGLAATEVEGVASMAGIFHGRKCNQRTDRKAWNEEPFQRSKGRRAGRYRYRIPCPKPQIW